MARQKGKLRKTQTRGGDVRKAGTGSKAVPLTEGTEVRTSPGATVAGGLSPLPVISSEGGVGGERLPAGAAGTTVTQGPSPQVSFAFLPARSDRFIEEDLGGESTGQAPVRDMERSPVAFPVLTQAEQTPGEEEIEAQLIEDAPLEVAPSTPITTPQGAEGLASDEALAGVPTPEDEDAHVQEFLHHLRKADEIDLDNPAVQEEAQKKVNDPSKIDRDKPSKIDDWVLGLLAFAGTTAAGNILGRLAGVGGTAGGLAGGRAFFTGLEGGIEQKNIEEELELKGITKDKAKGLQKVTLRNPQDLTTRAGFFDPNDGLFKFPDGTPAVGYVEAKTERNFVDSQGLNYVTFGDVGTILRENPDTGTMERLNVTDFALAGRASAAPAPAPTEPSTPTPTEELAMTKADLRNAGLPTDDASLAIARDELGVSRAELIELSQKGSKAKQRRDEKRRQELRKQINDIKKEKRDRKAEKAKADREAAKTAKVQTAKERMDAVKARSDLNKLIISKTKGFDNAISSANRINILATVADGKGTQQEKNLAIAAANTFFAKTVLGGGVLSDQDLERFIPGGGIDVFRQQIVNKIKTGKKFTKEEKAAYKELSKLLKKAALEEKEAVVKEEVRKFVDIWRGIGDVRSYDEEIKTFLKKREDPLAKQKAELQKVLDGPEGREHGLRRGRLLFWKTPAGVLKQEKIEE